MNYQRSFEDAIARLKAEGRYRTFANLSGTPVGSRSPSGARRGKKTGRAK